MAEGVHLSACLGLLIYTVISVCKCQVLTPPTFNLAKGRNITASATCGLGVAKPELYCQLTGVGDETVESGKEIIQGQLCDYCDPADEDMFHPADNAIDGSEHYWQSPPLSRGDEFNKVDLQIDLGQEFHIAYIIIKMANSPRPGVWALEKSMDYGQNWEAWQYFADTPIDCMRYFSTEISDFPNRDNQVICTTDFSRIVPLVDGEIFVSLVNGRPSANNFSLSDELKEFMKATNVRIRLLRAKTLLGHLMAVQNQDPTVTRRYYYSIKDISLGGRCVCNGHADTCNYLDPLQANKLICDCQHNTVGDQCQMCDAENGFVQKKWQPARENSAFVCEPCQCYYRARGCVYDADVDEQGLSIDIHGFYNGGGVCQNCAFNTTGINCEKCLPGFYRPYGVALSSRDMCAECQCDPHFHINECEEETGQCVCKPEFTGYNCDRCSVGYYGYPDCIPCDCDVNGTDGDYCHVNGGQCPCKENYVGKNCDMCQKGFYNFPVCEPCECNGVGSEDDFCDVETGQCSCRMNYGTRNCSECSNGYYNYPECDLCECDTSGTVEDVCDKMEGQCLCQEVFDGDRCDYCARGYYAYPDCMPCLCQEPGSSSNICQDRSGQCQCKPNYAGQNCERCAAGYYRYPDCVRCECDQYGSLGATCDQETGQCDCKYNFQGQMCDSCKEGLYNYPNCEECNCNPNGAKEVPGYPLGGCGEVVIGRLCECKERVIGRICDTCNPGYWNLHRNNPLGCEECGCSETGSVAGLNMCDMVTGQCRCKVSVTGRTCDRCKEGYYSLDKENLYGCIECNCDIGGSESAVCNKQTGQCPCKPRVNGQRCNEPIDQHFIPTLDQFRFEVEDGYTPEGTQVRYGYDERLFPDYSWRGYAILTKNQPEVHLDFDIRKPSLYRLVYRFVNLNEDPVVGDVTLRPISSSEVPQHGEISFVPSQDPSFADVGNRGGYTTFVLNPGPWTAIIKTNDSIFLDYMFLMPQAYYEATVLQNTVYRPCLVPDDEGPCYHYSYPDVLDFPRVLGETGYTVDGDARTPVRLFVDQDILDELNVNSMAILDPSQKNFDLDLYIPTKDRYVFILNYYSVANGTETVLFEIGDDDQALGILYNCQYSSLCRQVLLGLDEMVGVFDLDEGFVRIRVTADDDVDAALESIVAIPYDLWKVGYIRPSIVCIRINGVCVGSRYATPVGSVRIDFEDLPNDHLVADVYPPNVENTDTKLVRLNDTLDLIVLLGQARIPGVHKFLVHYYLPYGSGETMQIELFANGQQYQGTFTPRYCPSIHGCRDLIYFYETGQSGNMDLIERDVKIVFENTNGQEIWLDYLLLIPSSQYSPTDIMILPVDNSRNFIETCLDEGYKIKVPITDYCEKALFSLTTEFNNGALQCECDVDGSTSLQCDQHGGQCSCRPNVIGRQCSACAVGYFGFPRCRPCNCPFGLCEQFTGQCICPPRVTGDRCDVCQPATYGYDALIGCQECQCNILGVVDRDLNCDEDTGSCRCLDGIGGRKCDYCLAGFYSFPQCRECDCDRYGTTDKICDPESAFCICKENVVGPRCDQCRAFTYNLEPTNPQGCTNCFCFGNTANCRQSSFTWDILTDMDGWAITNTVDDVLRDAGDVIAILDALDQIQDTNTSMYWVAPGTYLGNRVRSYGGFLHYESLFVLPRNDSIITEYIAEPDIVLVGNQNQEIAHTATVQPYDGQFTPMSIQLYEYNFVHRDTGINVDRETFMMVLANLEAILIRASYYSVVQQVRLTKVELDVAVEGGFGEQAYSVEECACPRGYMGSSCEDCAQSYYRARSFPFLGVCQKCDCNGHTADCDLFTGECIRCANNTMGSHCEKCQPGYTGDPSTGGCNICGCPLPMESNNFADQCSATSDGYVYSCECYDGYTGDKCERCSPGYYGDPYTEGDTCKLCQCSNNLNMRDPESCDYQTGQCQRCINNSTGPQCERCQDWWYGDAVVAKDCYPCSCNQCGSLMCNSQFGQCTCKPNVIGINCDDCAPDTYGFDNCQGCFPCECGDAALDTQCDAYNGSCVCQPGVTGHKCDQCINGYWNYQLYGCEECNCEFDGAVTCDPVDGKCQCLPGVTGPTCDQCLDRWVLIPQEGCRECDSCIDHVMDDLEYMDSEIMGVQSGLTTVSIGVAAMRRLDAVNMSVIDLQPQVVSVLYESENITLEPAAAELARLQGLLSNIHAQSEGSISDAKDIIANGRLLVDNSDEAIILGGISNKEATDAILYINEILRQINEGIKVTNIETYIAMSEQIIAEMHSRNFTGQNESISDDIEEASLLLMAVKMLQIEPLQQAASVDTLGERILDTNERLSYLQQDSQLSESTSTKALSLIRGLRDDTVPNINMNVDEIDFALELITENTADSNDELEISAENMDIARREMSDVDNNLMSLKGAVAVLTENNKKFERLDEIAGFVNSTGEHAGFLQEQAAALENMYTDTRTTSSNALMAGQAYQNIVEAIDDARDAAAKTFMAADSAAIGSNGVGEQSKNFTMSSEMLLMEANVRYNTTQTDLLMRLDEAKLGTNVAEDNNKDVMSEVGKIKGKIQASNTSVVREMSNMVAQKGDNANEKAEITKNRVKTILDDLPKQLEKTIPLADDNVNAKRDMSQAKTQVQSVQKFIPNIQTLLTELTDESEKIKSLGQTVKTNIASLKEKIAIARNQANLIRVGLDFLGNTSVVLRNPRTVAQAGSYSQVSLYFKTDSENGLLLYAGSEMSSSNKPNQDYMALQIENGQVVFKYDLNTATANGKVSINHPHYVADGQWYKVVAKRIGKAGTLTLEHDPLKDELGSVMGMAKGTNTVLDLHPLTAKFYAGGLPEGATISDQVSRNYYDGVIEDIQFDDIPMGLWNFETGTNNYQGARERNVLTSIVSNGFRFDGSGFVILDREETAWKPAVKSQVSMRFKTYAENGLLFFAGKDRDFISIELHDGKLLYQYDLGGGRSMLTSRQKVNDGKWHDVQVNRQNRTGVMYVDFQICCQADSPGSLTQLSVSDDIYIGGYQGIILPVRDVTKVGFEGCVEDVVLQLITWDLNENKKAKGVIPGCPDQIARVATFSETDLSYVATPIESIGTNFDMTFKMKTKQEKALLLYAANDDQSAGFSVSLVDGKISVISCPGDIKETIMTRVNTYNDGRWHYISIMKKGRALEMNIDDYEKVRIDDQAGETSLQTTTPLYFGNTDLTLADDLVDTKQPFRGCIGDVTINGEFLNFAALRDNQRLGIALAGCPIPEPEGLYTRDPLPTIYPPTSSTTTTTAATPPPGRCFLDVVDVGEIGDSEMRGLYFGGSPNSRIEYSRLPKSLRIKSVINLEFRTTEPDGVIFYFADRRHLDHVSIIIKDGMIRYTFNSGTGPGEIMTKEMVNDGQWHSLSVARSLREGVMRLDGEEVGITESEGRARSINGKAPYYFGGIANPDELPDNALKNLAGVTNSFMGCLANIKLETADVGEPVSQTGTLPCANARESGAYYHGTGGYVKMVDAFKVGLDINVAVELRPRSLNGIIFSVHGDKGDFVILQLVKGELWFTADNGAGSIIAKYVPDMNNKLCDGGWHSISAVKNKNVVILSVDDEAPVATTSSKSATSTDTNNPMYLGGKPDSITKGVRAKGKYRGCIRNFFVNGERQYLATGVAFSDVRFDGCPLN